MKFGIRRTLLTILLTVRFATVAQAYGPLGHEIVGAIADERLANTPTATKIRALLGGFTLEKAAVIADEIKGWDKNGVDNPESFHYSAIGTSTVSCAISGEQIRRQPGVIQARLRIIGSTIQTFQSCRPKDTGTVPPAAPNGM